MSSKKVDIRKKYSPSELAEAFIFRSKATPDETKQADELLNDLRKKSLENMSEGQKLAINLLSLKYQMQDSAKALNYNPDKNLGAYIKMYSKAIQRKNYELANDLGMDETRFSQIINGHIVPSQKLVHRLEYHSDNLIPAKVWLDILHKDIQFYVQQDMETREKEYKTVRNRISVSSKTGFTASKNKDVALRLKELDDALIKDHAAISVYSRNKTEANYINERESAYAKKKALPKKIDRK